MQQKYIVLKNSDLFRLVNDVNKHMEEGYKLLGGVGVLNESINNTRLMHYQALCK
jgi:hypothetical protein